MLHREYPTPLLTLIIYSLDGTTSQKKPIDYHPIQSILLILAKPSARILRNTLKRPIQAIAPKPMKQIIKTIIVAAFCAAPFSQAFAEESKDNGDSRQDNRQDSREGRQDGRQEKQEGRQDNRNGEFL